MVLSAVTCQKDNLPIWIKDWCSWHTRVHGVDRIVIYDNNSSYFTDLDSILAELDEDLEIILVNWPYKFGVLPDSLSPQYRYCKIGTLNHFRLTFGEQTKWCINLDVDAFLYLSEEVSLKEYLATQVQIRSVVEAYHYLFPSSRYLANQQPRFYHPRMRYKEDYWNYRENIKYICQPSVATVMENHDIYFTTPRMVGYLFVAMLKGYRVFVGSLKSLVSHMYYQYKTQIQHRQQLTWSVIWAILMVEIMDTIKRMRELYKVLLRSLSLKAHQPLDPNPRDSKQVYPLNKLQDTSLFFGHFRDIYSNWREKKEITSKDPYFARRFQRIDKIDPHCLVLDDRIAKKAIEIGMIKEPENAATK